MKLTLTINSENAAFTGSNGPIEAARLLRQTADRIEQGYNCGRLMDINGNGAGAWDCEFSDIQDEPVNRDKVTCGNCGESWCEKCDPAPAALCHTCHGRGYSTHPIAR